jgi:hypothetical protein
MAEKEGFEPPDLLQSTVFKTAAIDHSAISPVKQSLPDCGANIVTFSDYAKTNIAILHIYLRSDYNYFITFSLDNNIIRK